MPFLTGNTFIHAPATRLRPHLWMVISDTDQDQQTVVIVNFTTWEKEIDKSCELDVGDHRFIKHKTCVRYQDARPVAVSKLEELEQKNLLARDCDLSEELLARILCGASKSPFIKNEARQFLSAQGLISAAPPDPWFPN